MYNSTTQQLLVYARTRSRRLAQSLIRAVSIILGESLPAITDLHSQTLGEGEVLLTWSYAGTTTVSVMRSTDGINYTAIATGLASTTTSFQDSGLSNGVRYFYRIAY